MLKNIWPLFLFERVIPQTSAILCSVFHMKWMVFDKSHNIIAVKCTSAQIYGFMSALINITAIYIAF